MIREVSGNLLDSKANILCHQVNFEGVMGGGIALALKNRFMSEGQYRSYQAYCDGLREKALGTILYTQIDEKQYIANMFCQNSWAEQGALTNYDAMRRCFREIEFAAARNHLSVAIPGFIGCGIAGGDWRIVTGIIKEIFHQSRVPVSVVYWDGM